MIKKFLALTLIAACIPACTTYKNVKLDSSLTPQAQTFLSQNGLADKRQFKNKALNAELRSYVTQNGKININNNNYASDCGDMFRGIGVLLTAGAFDIQCRGYTNICYDSANGECSKNYNQEFYANQGGWLQAPLNISSGEWSFEDNSTAQFNNSLITSINKMAAEN